MAGILIKSIYPSPVTLNNSDQLKSINSELGIIREQVYSVESRISDMSFSLPRATYTVTAIR